MSNNTRTISVLIVDDYNIVRQGLAALLSLESGIKLAGEAQTGREAVRLAEQLRPDIAIVDLAMPRLNGWETTRQLLQAVPRIKIIVLSTYQDDEHIQRAIGAGAAAYLLKQSAAEDLVKAIKEVDSGNAYFSPAIAHRLRAQSLKASNPDETKPATPPEEGLTVRESEVLQLIAEGFANKQIAGELGLSVKTVEKHRQQVMNKLRIHNTAGLVRHAIAKGIIESHRAGVPRTEDVAA